jgi:hypothetical protein
MFTTVYYIVHRGDLNIGTGMSMLLRWPLHFHEHLDSLVIALQ